MSTRPIALFAWKPECRIQRNYAPKRLCLVVNRIAGAWQQIWASKPRLWTNLTEIELNSALVQTIHPYPSIGASRNLSIHQWQIQCCFCGLRCLLLAYDQNQTALTLQLCAKLGERQKGLWPKCGQMQRQPHNAINAEKVKLSVFAGLFASVQRMSLVLCDSQAQLLRNPAFSLVFAAPVCVFVSPLLPCCSLKLINWIKG